MYLCLQCAWHVGWRVCVVCVFLVDGGRIRVHVVCVCLAGVFVISRQLGRAVKAIDSKSIGVTRAGSNPAAVEIIAFTSLPTLSSTLQQHPTRPQRNATVLLIRYLHLVCTSSAHNRSVAVPTCIYRLLIVASIRNTLIIEKTNKSNS